MKKHFILAITRVALGWIFFWAFLDKLYGLGFATGKESSWLNGSSPTAGFLTHATKGPFAEFFQGLAGNVLVDWLFMIGLAGIGIALILGVASRLATMGGATMMLLMFLAGFIPPEHNPFIDDHIINALLLILLYKYKAQDHLGLGEWWQDSKIVRKIPILK